VKEHNTREGYTLSVNKENILISGNSDAALLCAVYDLLARLGCAWLAPDFDVYEGNAEFVPSRSVLVFRSTGDIRQTPRFAYRKLDVDGGRTHNAENLEKLIEWMPKGGYNTLRVPVNLNNNGRVVWDRWRERLAPQLKKRGLLLEVGGHGYQAFINAEMENGTLFNNHPEWFGKDSSCNYTPSERLVFNTTNPEAVQYFIRSIVDYLKQRPEIDIFGLWPPDVGRWADCPEWRALGTPADRQALLANQVDSALKTIHKELRLEILAYSFTLSPPQKVKLHPGIQVDICPIDQSFEHQIYDPASANNSEYAREIKAWRNEFPGELGLYSYYRKYAWRSAPNVIPNYIQRDMQWYADIPLQGISTYCEPGDWFTYELNHYVLGHVARNPAIDVDSLSRVFFRVRFGRQWQEAGNAYAHLQEIMPVYGSIPFTSRKPAEKIAAALKKIQHQQAVIKEAVKTADQVPAGNFARLLLMYEYAEKDLQLQHALASGATVPEIQRQIRKLVVFLEANLDKGVFLLTGQNDFARFTKKYGLTNQSLLD